MAKTNGLKEEAAEILEAAGSTEADVMTSRLSYGQSTLKLLGPCPCQRTFG